jgi:hypothetical protein
MVSSSRREPLAKVDEDLLACGQTVNGVVGNRPTAVFARGIALAATYQKPFIVCLESRGYTAEPWQGEK